MEINLRQRVIGGVVLIALAIIFIPLLFKNPTAKIKHVTMETAIPAAPTKPNMQTTITMQGEELNPQQNIAATNNDAATSATISSEKQLLPQNNQVASEVKTTNATTHETIAQATTDTAKSTVVPASITSDEVAVEAKPEEDVPVNKLTKHHINKSHTTAKSTTAAAQKKVTSTTHKAKVITTPSAKAIEPKLQPAKAWVVQLGSFSDTKKAKILEKQLRAKGYAAYTQTAKTKVGTMTRVYVGPEIQRDKANILLTRLDSSMHMKGVIVPFDPTHVK